MIIGGLFLLIGCICFFSVSKTIKIYRQNQKILMAVHTNGKGHKSINQLTGALKKLNNELNIHEKVDVESDFLKLLGEICTENNIQIKGISTPRDNELNKVKSETFEIKLNGNFKEMLKVIQGLEENLYYGNISSLKFESKTDRKTKSTYLEAMINVQVIFLNDVMY